MGCCILCIIVLWSFFLGSDFSARYQAPTTTTINTNWSQVVDGVSVPLALVQDAVSQPTEETITVTYTIPPLDNIEHLLFHASHQEVAIYVDDVLHYQLSCPESLSMFASPGRTWVSMPIGTAMAGKTLRIEFSSAFPLYDQVPSNLYLISSEDIQQVQIHTMLFRGLMALVMVGLGIISYGNATIWKDKKLRCFLFSLADLYLFSGLWLCAEVGLFSLLTASPSVSSLLGMVFIRVIPLTFYQLLRASSSYTPPWVHLVGVLVWVNFFLSLVLQFFFGISLVTTLPVTVATFCLCCVICLVGFLHHRIKRRTVHRYDSAYYATSILLVATLIEGFCYVNHQTLGHLNGLFVSIACILYAGVIHVLLLRNESNTDVEKRQLESTYNQLQIKPLYQQINAHFLFNSLNAISAFCKEAPEQADIAVNYLAQYLRNYVNLVDCGAYVPFEREVSLIHLYMKMSNMRYEETILLNLDTHYSEFTLPPLTLQPLIENAVSHGLHGFVTDGVITITTRRYGDWVTLIVKDNGNGFSTECPTNTAGVGLKNLTRRIKAMGGTLRVESAPNKGTEAILQIPLIPIEYKETEAK